MSEIALSVRECFATTFQHEVKALWQITSMQVAFGLSDVEQLLNIIKAAELPQGRFAFVVGQQQFLRGVVESVRSLRNDWTTTWRTFESTEDALEWLSSD